MNPREDQRLGGKPQLLDLFCKAGGAARGYQDAGFHVTGVDVEPQPRYAGDRFVQADALEYLAEQGWEYTAVHASPACQAYSTTAALHDARYPRWIAVVRILAEHAGVPYIIENVAGARRFMRNPVLLCGSSFGLGVRRHRLFETSFTVGFVPPCAHYLQPEPVDVTGTGASRLGERLDGGGGNSRKPRNLAHARDVMGIDWMTRPELSEAVPPAFTHWLGEQLLAHLSERAA